MKKQICLFLAMAVVFALMAGCTVEKNIGPDPATTIPVDEAALKEAADLLGDLDAVAMNALREAMEKNNVTIPAYTEPPEPPPPAMPQGVQTNPNDVFPLMEKVYNTFASGTFYLKAKGSAPMGGPNMGTTPMTIAIDGQKTMMEFDMDWASLFVAMTEGTPDAGRAKIQGYTAQTLFGKKVRFVSMPEDGYMIFLDKKTYLPIGAFSEPGAEVDVDMASAFSGSFVPEVKPTDIGSSKVTMGGQEYLCATLNDGQARYYFLNGDLKRIEIENQGEIMILEIQELTGKVDPKLFSVDGMKAMPLDQMSSLADSMGSLF